MPEPIARRGILDTSVFIASESGRTLAVDRLPDELATTVVTIGELEAGVLASPDTAIRAQRLRTLSAASDMERLAVDEATAHAWASLRVRLAETRRRMPVNDSWIAACALSRGLPVVTQDLDYDILAEVSELVVIHV